MTTVPGVTDCFKSCCLISLSFFFSFYFRCDSEMTSSFHNKSSYNSQEKYATTRLHSIGAVETCKSSVFRSGDWNEAESSPQPCSVTCQDFHIKPFSVDASDCNTNTEVNSKKLNTETGCPVDSTGSAL